MATQQMPPACPIRRHFPPAIVDAIVTALKPGEAILSFVPGVVKITKTGTYQLVLEGSNIVEKKL